MLRERMQAADESRAMRHPYRGMPLTGAPAARFPKYLWAKRFNDYEDLDDNGHAPETLDIGASEHDACRSIRGDICAYAHTLRRGLPNSVDVKQFLMLLHRTITNRALNLALHKTIDQSLSDDLLVGPVGRRVTEHGRQALADLLEQCLDIVEQDYQDLRTDMRQFRC